MLNKPQQDQLSKFLQGITEVLDLTPTQIKEAKERYQAVGNWLDADDSPLHQYSPEIYPQGSFRLGTMIKPLTDKEEYDIDLVCKLNNPPTGITQKRLKDMVGERLKAYARKHGMKKPEESKRCWRLEYADGTCFHMDILPAVPDPTRNLYEAVLEEHVYRHALRITCRENEGFQYSTNLNDWNKSNPVGYSEWFKDSMKTTFRNRKLQLLLEAKVEDVDDWEVKTPLQRAIQVMKRHRDIMFQNDMENKPISIIITTLATRAYNEEDDVYAALTNIIERMPNQIEEDEFGNALIKNPVNPDENFADKWVNNNLLEENFYKWLRAARNAFSDLKEQRGIHKIKEKYGRILGSGIVAEAFHKSAALEGLRAEANTLKFDRSTGYVGTVGTTIPKKDFHGKG